MNVIYRAKVEKKTKIRSVVFYVGRVFRRSFFGLDPLDGIQFLVTKYLGLERVIFACGERVKTLQGWVQDVLVPGGGVSPPCL